MDANIETPMSHIVSSEQTSRLPARNYFTSIKAKALLLVQFGVLLFSHYCLLVCAIYSICLYLAWQIKQKSLANAKV